MNIIFEIVEFWVINGTGAPMYWFSFDEDLDPFIEHKFITYICKHVKELEDGAEAIKNEQTGVFEMESYFYYYLASPGINSIFIAKSAKKFELISIYFNLSQVERTFTHFFMKKLKKISQNKLEFIDSLENIKEQFDNYFFKEFFEENLR